MAKRSKLDEEEVAKLMWLIARVRAGASLGEIAETLNAMGITTPRGGRWNAQKVSKALERAQEARSEP
jgi:Recombinase